MLEQTSNHLPKNLRLRPVAVACKHHGMAMSLVTARVAYPLGLVRDACIRAYERRSGCAVPAHQWRPAPTEHSIHKRQFSPALPSLVMTSGSFLGMRYASRRDSPPPTRRDISDSYLGRLRCSFECHRPTCRPCFTVRCDDIPTFRILAWHFFDRLGEPGGIFLCISQEGPVAQRLRRLTTDQEIPGSNPGGIATLVLNPCFSFWRV
ncbi:hypothetical protein BCR44DRAFT_254973 [Catenaria anguillulae PL171]|uniref:Uncharacterized protein n=1 Tax=Catenaria anguillulae PL171 TaxID=765915 RepID=A0A1Y2I3E7_9FUNG|nr:hypothetical protein BCR44DRAFT_254973 [Catenaria anguillulae PL171]